MKHPWSMTDQRCTLEGFRETQGKVAFDSPLRQDGIEHTFSRHKLACSQIIQITLNTNLCEMFSEHICHERIMM